MILHLSSSDLAQAVSDGILASPIPKLAQSVTQRFWPGPLTLILPKGPRIPSEVTSGLETVAVRCPSDPSASLLLKQLGHPLAAPSANRFGRISPTDASAVLAELDGKIPLILDGGPCTNGIESTVLSLSESKPVILRPGSIDSQTLSSFLQMDVPIRNSSGNAQSPSPLLECLTTTTLQGPHSICAAPQSKRSQVHLSSSHTQIPPFPKNRISTF